MISPTDSKPFCHIVCHIKLALTLAAKPRYVLKYAQFPVNNVVHHDFQAGYFLPFLEHLYPEDLYDRCSEEGSRDITAERDSFLDALTCRQTPTPLSNRAAAASALKSSSIRFCPCKYSSSRSRSHDRNHQPERHML